MHIHSAEIYHFFDNVYRGVGMNTDKILTKFDCERMQQLLDGYSAENESELKLIGLLKQYINHSKLVDSKKIKSHVVTMNSKVILRNIGTGKKEEFHLVFPDESDLKKKKLSVISGLGTQILGSSTGTVIKDTASSNQYYQIEEIVYQPEAAGHYHL